MSTNYFDRYGEAVLSVLNKRNMPQKTLADAVSMDKSALNILINKTKRPHPNTRSDINNYLNVDIHQDRTGKWKLNYKQVEESFNTEEGAQLSKKITDFLSKVETNTDDNHLRPILLILRDQVKSHLIQAEAQVQSSRSMLSVIDSLLDED